MKAVSCDLSVALRTDVDVLHEKDQAKFQAALAAPITLSDGMIRKAPVSS
jgi:hypothetical protein